MADVFMKWHGEELLRCGSVVDDSSRRLFEMAEADNGVDAPKYSRSEIYAIASALKLATSFLNDSSHLFSKDYTTTQTTV